MIKIDFNWAMASYIFIIIALVIGHWIFYTCRRDKGIFIDSKFFQECPYCTYIFLNYEEGDLKMCPRCRSYITEENRKSGG